MPNLRESLLLNVVLPIAEKLNGTKASYWYQQIKKMNRWNKEEIELWQNKRLQSLVQHAYNHTVYYKNLFDSLGIKPEEIQCAADLRKLPVMTKEIANKHHDELIPDNIRSIKHRKGKTGGTTGEPMLYFCDENTWGYVTAAKMYAWKTAGYRYGDPFVALGSASLFAQKPSLKRQIYDKIRNEHPLNSVNLTDELCQKYIAYIKDKKIKFVYGYAASIYMLSRYILSHQIRLTQIKAVFTTSEMLTDDYRASIEKAFNCRLMDCYGARDAGMNAYEISRHNYHVGYNVIAETEESDIEKSGVVLSTNLLNYSFPLIRYRYGDEVELDQSVSETEYNGQVIRRVIGRTSDIMHLANGRNLSATGFSMMMKEFDVVAFDFKKVGDCEVLLRVQPIPGKYNQEQESKIIETITNYIGKDCKLNLEHVDHFEPLKNGKRRYFYNEK